VQYYGFVLFREGDLYAQLNNARLFYDTVGSHLALGADRMEVRPTLIALHGGPGFDHAPMRPYFDRFADTHQVLYLDHRGNGRSTGAPDTWTLAQWGADVKALCDQLGIEKPVVFGVSFGGMVAMSYAAQFPDHPAKLILASTAARLRLDETYRIMEEKGGSRAREVAKLAFEQGDEGAMAEYLTACLPLYNPRPDPEGAVSRKRAIIRNDVARHFFLGEMRTMDFRESLSRLQCPTLVLAGAHDPITPIACSEEIAARSPASLVDLLTFADAGHGVHRDEPEGTETAMRAFLSR
jgi:proline iminopeptidase